MPELKHEHKDIGIRWYSSTAVGIEYSNSRTLEIGAEELTAVGELQPQ
jgi:hypothetical protein